MNLDNLIADIRTTISRNLGRPFAVVGKLLGRRHPPLRRSADDGTGAPTPAPAAAPATSAELPPVVSELPLAERQHQADARPLADIPPQADALTPAAVPPPPAAPPVVAPRTATRRKAAPKARTPRAAPPVLAADPELDALRARVSVMEARVVDLEADRAEIDQRLADFAFCQYQALGDVLGEQLRLQHEVLRQRAERSTDPEDEEAAAAAAEEYAAYQREGDTAAATPPALAYDERKELRSLYRAAAMRCHPDRVVDAEKARAHEIFLRTQDAYRRRDLAALRQISQELAAERPLPAADSAAPRKHLEALLERLIDKGADLLLAIQTMKMQAQYRLAQRREDWDDHFAALRQQLEAECQALRRELGRY